jgi:hypothetical protein
METASGLVIAKSLSYPASCNHTRFEKKSRAHYRGTKRNLEDSRLLFPMKGRTYRTPARAEESFMSIGTIILIILVIALLGGFSGIGGGPFYGTGYYGGGGLGLVIVILLILLLLGRL